MNTEKLLETVYAEAYEKSGSCKGNFDDYKSYYQSKHASYLLESKNQHNELTKVQIEKINEIDTKIANINQEILNKELSIKSKNSRIEVIEQEILKYQKRNIEDLPDELRFRPHNFIIYLAIFIGLSIFLYLFYGQLFHLAFGGRGNELPKLDSLQWNTMSFIAPVFFLAIAILPHLVISREKRINILNFSINLNYFIIFIILILALVLEFVMCSIINTKEMINLPMRERVGTLQNPKTWLFLGFGFVGYIVWSIILTFMLKEYEKRKNPHLRAIQMLNTEKKQLIDDISLLNEQLNPLRAELDNYRNKKRYVEQTYSVNIDELIAILRKLTEGWIAYLILPEHEERRKLCIEFSEDYIKKIKENQI